ncbi:hypothetical protein ANN_07866 [Periplaneta americana]|uniref:Uncharacterized protein n=1 Tax=Periplaneta americana TaxID=6978 RepID=A0ABQ8SZT0_PERAM|nr:hypothetical protein ANN_07866 [Periplaneta americana]
MGLILRHDHRLVGRPEGKRPLGRPRRRWEDNIKVDLREVGHDGRDWMNLAQDRDQWRAYVRAQRISGFLKCHRRGKRGRAPCTSVLHSFCQRPASGQVPTGGSHTLGNYCAGVRLQHLDLPRALYGAETWALQRSEEKGIEAFEIYIWRRIERVKWTDKIRNEVVLKRVGEERMMLKLSRKRKRNWLGLWLRRNYLLKDALEGMMNGRKVRGRRRHQMIDGIKIYGSYEEKKRKAENGKIGECWVCILESKTLMSPFDSNCIQPLFGFIMSLAWLNRPAQGLRFPSRLTAHERNADISCALYKGGLEEGVISYKIYTKLMKKSKYVTCSKFVSTYKALHFSRASDGGNNAENIAYRWNIVMHKEKPTQRCTILSRKLCYVRMEKVTQSRTAALYSSPYIIRNIKSGRLRWAGHVARMGESRNAYRMLVGRLEGKRPLGRPRRWWEDNIKMDLREVGYDDRDWINLAQDRGRWRAYVRAAMNLRVP